MSKGMKMKVLKLYSQFSQLIDRRQESESVENDRRSGIDRRVNIDSSLRQDLKQVTDTFKAYVPQNNSVIEGALNTIPTTRRLVNVKDNKDNNKVKAAGLGLIGLINAKEDLRDLMSIIGRSKSEAPEGYFALYKFFAGSFLERPLENTDIGMFILHKLDKPIADTEIGRIIQSKLDVKEEREIFQKQIKFPFNKKEIIIREYIKHDGSFIGKLVCLSMNRATKLGLLFMSLLELPAIYKSAKEKGDYSQITKSIVNVASCTICGALGSALLSLITCGHPASSVIGLGLGLFVGNKLSLFLNHF